MLSMTVIMTAACATFADTDLAGFWESHEDISAALRRSPNGDASNGVFFRSRVSFYA